jgi:hypothetical protein
LWRRNIWHTARGSAINPDSGAVGAWSQSENIFWQTVQPPGTSLTNPQLVSPRSGPRFWDQRLD